MNFLEYSKNPPSPPLPDPSSINSLHHSLGIINIFICIPQMVGSLIAFVVFSILEPGKSPELSDNTEFIEKPRGGVNAIAVCMGIGGICTVMAAHYTIKFKNNYS
jgi:solute carrier family 45 protein 1/2/4